MPITIRQVPTAYGVMIFDRVIVGRLEIIGRLDSPVVEV